MGGRGAGRSTVASQFALAKLIENIYFRCAIMRFILTDIRNSIFREITDRAEENEIKDKIRINEGMMALQYRHNSINAVGFRKASGDQKSKLKSLANYNCVIIEEADEIPEQDFMQLDDTLRTVKADITIILLLNPPPKSHWIIRRWFDLLPSGVADFYVPKLKPEFDSDTLFIRTSYLDNIKNIAPETFLNYERYKQTKPEHYYNLVRGLVPEVVRGKIYSGWIEIPEVPETARLLRHWLDFGYVNDPTAIGDLYEWNGCLVFDEQAYTTGLLNPQIASIIKNLAKAITVADSAEPKSIDEIAMADIAIIPAKKGSDSIRNGIDQVQSQKIYVTKRSRNIWNEYNNYAWREDKNGEMSNEPKDVYNHHMDGIRYAVSSLDKFSASTRDEQNARMNKTKNSQTRNSSK